MKLFFARLFYRAGLSYWASWSRLYRVLFHSKYRKLSILDHNPKQANEALKRLGWVGDGRKELWDACGSPGWVQHCLNESTWGTQPEGALDCEDFSTWACAALSKAAFSAQLLTVVYMRDGKLSGHAVCMITKHVDKNTNSYSHLSNWGLYGGFADRLLVVADILNKAKAEHLVGWALLGHDDMSVHYWQRG